jgi:hypothetical protein
LNIVKGTLYSRFSFENSCLKKLFNLKGYGFDVFGTTDLAGFDANIANGYYAQAIADAHLILKCFS